MRFLAIVSGIFLIVGCGKPRSPDEIFAEKLAVPQLYLSTQSQARLIAPGNKGVFIDPSSKEEFRCAVQCVNPSCPKRSGDQPFLFVLVDDGSDGCPACASLRDRKTESAAEAAKYAAFVQPYVLPESKARLDKLEKEFQEALQREIKQKNRQRY